jgi:hypothetical protein
MAKYDEQKKRNRVILEIAIYLITHDLNEKLGWIPVSQEVVDERVAKILDDGCAKVLGEGK